MHDTGLEKIKEEKDSGNVQGNEDSEIRSQMEQMVSSYDSYMKKITLGRENALRSMTVSLAQVKTGDSGLEIGCGTGSLTMEAKRTAGPSGKVSGIDVLPGMIDLSRQKAVKNGLDISFQLGSIDNIPFPEEQFDVVMCSFMIFHMSETTRRKGINEIFRVLKPNGKLLVLDLAFPINPLPRMLAKLFLGFMIKHDLKELLPLMEAAGFSGIENAQAKFKIFGFPILSFVCGTKLY